MTSEENNLNIILYKKKKCNILFQSKESKNLKKIDGSYGYFQEQTLIFKPPCCFLKLEENFNENFHENNDKKIKKKKCIFKKCNLTVDFQKL